MGQLGVHGVGATELLIALSVFGNLAGIVSLVLAIYWRYLDRRAPPPPPYPAARTQGGGQANEAMDGRAVDRGHRHHRMRA